MFTKMFHRGMANIRSHKSSPHIFGDTN